MFKMKRYSLIILFIIATGAMQKAYAGWPIGKYRNVVIPSFNYYTSKDTWDGNGHLIKGKPGAGFTSYSFGLYAGYGITRRLDVIVNVLAPMQHSSYRNAQDSLIVQQSSGIGDLQAGLSYNLINFNYTSFLSVMASGIVPLYNNADKPVALGYGIGGAELKLMYSGSINGGFLKHCYFNVEGAFRRYFNTQGPNVVIYGVSLGVPVGPISTTGSPGASREHRSDDPPISSTIVDTSPLSRSTHAPVSASPSMPSRLPSTRAALDS